MQRRWLGYVLAVIGTLSGVMVALYLARYTSSPNLLAKAAASYDQGDWPKRSTGGSRCSQNPAG